jgi:hypothetical protein
VAHDDLAAQLSLNARLTAIFASIGSFPSIATGFR